MRRIVHKTNQDRKKTKSNIRRPPQREIEPPTHVIERKPTRASKKSIATTASTSSSRGRAKRVGRAVGKILGRVIGTVEQTVAKVMPGPRPKAARKASSRGRRKQRS